MSQWPRSEHFGRFSAVSCQRWIVYVYVAAEALESTHLTKMTSPAELCLRPAAKCPGVAEEECSLIERAIEIQASPAGCGGKLTTEVRDETILRQPGRNGVFTGA